MSKYIRNLAVTVLIASIMACNFSTELLTPQVANPLSGTVLPTAFISADTPVPEDLNAPTPTTEYTPTPEGPGDICLLVDKGDIEKFFGEPASDPKSANGGCTFTNVKDGLYAFSLGAGQDKDTATVLQGQAMLLGFAGIKLDETTIGKLNKLADAQDFKRYLSELVAQSKGTDTISARLFKGGGNDLTYWAWITTPPRRSGAFLAVRGTTLVSLYFIVPETQEEKAMLTGANNLAGQIFAKLPSKFSFMNTSQTPDSQEQVPATDSAPVATQENQQATQPPSSTAAGATPTTAVSSSDIPVLLSPADGTEINIYPRTITLTWSPVTNASKYLVEIMACSPTSPDTCFSHPMIEQTTRESTTTSYTFNFVGKQPGKWRVSAFDASGKLGTPSGWFRFTCLQ